MEATTHVGAVCSFAEKLSEFSNQGGGKNKTPILALAEYLVLDPKSPRFSKILSWIIEFYQQCIGTIDDSTGISEDDKDTAKGNLEALFSPFLPPFQDRIASNIPQWYKHVLDPTKRAYFGLLSNSILEKEFPIFIPSEDEINSIKNDLNKILQEQQKLELPQWINDDFADSVGTVLLAIEKLPFLAHRIIQDSHSRILALLFSPIEQKQKSFLVKSALTINAILAAYIMPFEGYQATEFYHKWLTENGADIKLIKAAAEPLKLPAPEKDSKKETKEE